MVGVIRRFAALLSRRDLRGSAGWSVLARLPVYLFTLAVVLLVREQGGGFAFAGLLAALYTGGVAVVGPIVARWVDRIGPRWVLRGTGVAFPLAVLVLVWLPQPGGPVQCGCAVLAGAVLPPANSVIRKLWANAPLSTEIRQTAYLWEALLTELLVIGAPAVLAALMLTGSAGSGLSVVAVLGGIGSWGLSCSAGLRFHRPVEAAARRAAGLGREPGFRALIMVMLLSSIPIGLTGLAVPAFVDAAGQPARTGLVYACWGIGSALGALLLGGAVSAAGARWFAGYLLLFALGAGLPVLAWSEPTLAVALAVGGTPISVVSACEMVLVGELVPERSLTEAFTWASTATIVGDALGQQAGGLLVEAVGARGVFGIACATASVAALAALLLSTRLHSPGRRSLAAGNP